MGMRQTFKMYPLHGCKSANSHDLKAAETDHTKKKKRRNRPVVLAPPCHLEKQQPWINLHTPIHEPAKTPWDTSRGDTVENDIASECEADEKSCVQALDKG